MTTVVAIPQSRFPIPASPVPIPASASRFPIPDSRFPLPASRFPLPESNMPPVNITIRHNGPYRVEIENEADIRLVDHENNPVALPGLKFALCRCGASSKKPFCDGTHSKIGFKGAQEAAAEFDANKSGELGVGDRESRPAPSVREEGPV